MNDEKLGLFDGEDMPDARTAWILLELCRDFNIRINLNETVKANRNFYIGKQWEGVQANGLPQPVFNILKRIVGFHVASMVSENLKANVTPLANTPKTYDIVEPARIVNEEIDALMEHNHITTLVKELARNAAVDGDGCIYAYWDADVNCGGGIMGALRFEAMDNDRVFFGNPNDRDVQSQPYIQITSREIVREVKIRAKENKSKDWKRIIPDTEDYTVVDSAKYTDDKCTVVLTLWKNPEDGTVWAYESTKDCEIRKPWSLGIQSYPLIWFNWDYITDCYHGQSMITGLIPNQIFINKAWAMSMLSIMRSAWPKVVYDKTRIARWDNRVGGAIGINGGDANSAVKIVDPPTIDPQIANFISMAVKMTEESLGATEAALGEGKAYNTSAILSLQRAAATPIELQKQNLYRAVEDLFRISIEFMAEYYGVRSVDIENPQKVAEAQAFIGQTPDATIPEVFDFSQLKDMPMSLKMEVGASSYYSEVASMQTLDNMLTGGFIQPVDYLERIPDSYFPKRRKLIEQMRAQMMAPPPPAAAPGGGPMLEPFTAPQTEITGGRGYSAPAREVNAQS
jgi:hypothetical protein